MQNFFLRLAFKPFIWELIIAIGSSKLYFADHIFAIQGQNRKSKFTIIYPATIYDRKNFCPYGSQISIPTFGRKSDVKYFIQKSTIIPVDTWRKSNIHKTFRSRPGRLLNVLCTFNLRPVSTGMWRYLLWIGSDWEI